MKLANNIRNCETRGVGVKMNRKIRIKVLENGCRSEAMLELIKCALDM